MKHKRIYLFCLFVALLFIFEITQAKTFLHVGECVGEKDDHQLDFKWCYEEINGRTGKLLYTSRGNTTSFSLLKNKKSIEDAQIDIYGDKLRRLHAFFNEDDDDPAWDLAISGTEEGYRAMCKEKPKIEQSTEGCSELVLK